MRLSEFMENNEFPGLFEVRYMDRDNNDLKQEEVMRIGFDPEVIFYNRDIISRTLLVFLDVSKDNIKSEKEILYEPYRKASKDLKMAMEILQEDGFSREEAFELVKRGTFIGFASFTNLSGE